MKCIDNPRQLHVLYVSDGGPRVEALSEVLKNRGHCIKHASSLREILLASESHVLVLDVAERDEEHAQQLLEEIAHAGTELPLVMINSERSYELCCIANDFHVAALIQNAFAPTSLVNAVEHCADDHSPDAPALIEHRERYPSVEASSELALGELSTFLEEAQLASVHIARILVASAELIDNVERHAYEGRGDFMVQASTSGSRLRVCISDEGCGMDQKAAQLEAMPPALPAARQRKPISHGAAIVFGGLSRAARLADKFEAKSSKTGSVIELEFELSPVACVDELLPEISELQPPSMRNLVRSIELNKSSLQELTPVLALTVQRLVGPKFASRRLLKKV